ncbi:hypothetical protein [Streptomyces sp. NBC_00091]|uniref:hypothetical protein n=1 Tax=Streptomyces sp. NBC_00091 TaxID=2975648 RepID=UPI0022537BE7|nr:hypothetical protein [Streptomyces sp. NBC_00091]MCX5379383.1 hypothetical protein [Streptomyces sp. NBC_00091]
MLDTSQGEPPAPASEAPIARAAASLAPQASPASDIVEGRGCLFALSQPPLMIFLAVIGTLLLLAALHDLYLL